MSLDDKLKRELEAKQTLRDTQTLAQKKAAEKAALLKKLQNTLSMAIAFLSMQYVAAAQACVQSPELRAHIGPAFAEYGLEYSDEMAQEVEQWQQKFDALKQESPDYEKELEELMLNHPLLKDVQLQLEKGQAQVQDFAGEMFDHPQAAEFFTSHPVGSQLNKLWETGITRENCQNALELGQQLINNQDFANTLNSFVPGGTLALKAGLKMVSTCFSVAQKLGDTLAGAPAQAESEPRKKSLAERMMRPTPPGADPYR